MKRFEGLFNNSPKFKLVEKGKVKNENLYSARRQTNAGRYLAALFIYKETKEALNRNQEVRELIPSD